jgi:hypothetical protein
MRLSFIVPGSLLAAASAFTLAQIGCGGKDPAVPTMEAGAPDAYVWTPPPPPPPPFAYDAGGGPAPTGGQAVPIDPTAAAALQPILIGLAQSDAAGMAPDGQSFAGNFPEGSILEHPIQIQPNKCYTIVGGAVGITQLDISLVLQLVPALPATPLANTTSPPGPTAVVGGKSVGCWKNPTPLAGPGKIIVRALKGTGIAAVQVFSK